jgi:hypothetical protein
MLEGIACVAIMVFGVGGADTQERAPVKIDAPLTLVKTN